MKPPLTQSEAILNFLGCLKFDLILPARIEIMHPLMNEGSFQTASLFYNKYYSDTEQRVMIFGINPGRFGGGITGIPFTDPQKLQDICGIANPYDKRRELSADFVYAMIDAFGGPEKFYRKFYITAVCPLGLLRGGRNLNYYDDNKLYGLLQDFIVESIHRQLSMISSTKICICLGEGKNLKYLNSINHEFRFFEKIIPLPHPRWIMQYRRKQLGYFIKLYCDTLNSTRV